MKIGKIISFTVVTLVIFSIWVAFALLVINPYLHSYIPGYQVGKPCGWEFVALAISLGIAFLWTRRWPNPRRSTENGATYITISYRFVLFLLCYMVAAILIFLWQYMEFSAGIT